LAIAGATCPTITESQPIPTMTGNYSFSINSQVCFTGAFSDNYGDNISWSDGVWLWDGNNLTLVASTQNSPDATVSPGPNGINLDTLCVSPNSGLSFSPGDVFVAAGFGYAASGLDPHNGQGAWGPFTISPTIDLISVPSSVSLN
jgi:hypothetical protein